MIVYFVQYFKLWNNYLSFFEIYYFRLSLFSYFNFCKFFIFLMLILLKYNVNLCNLAGVCGCGGQVEHFIWSVYLKCAHVL